jgi:hypothetical protein
MFPQHFQPPPLDDQAAGEGAATSSESSSDEDAEGASDVGDPFEDVDEGGVYAFNVRGIGEEVRVMHRHVVRSCVPSTLSTRSLP